MTYSTDKNFAANTVIITAERAFDVIGMNKKGHKPASLTPTENEQQAQSKEYHDVLEESVSRFDSVIKKKIKKHIPNSDKRYNNKNQGTRK
jgi:hypothetical protein